MVVYERRAFKAAVAYGGPPSNSSFLPRLKVNIGIIVHIRVTPQYSFIRPFGGNTLEGGFSIAVFQVTLL